MSFQLVTLSHKKDFAKFYLAEAGKTFKTALKLIQRELLGFINAIIEVTMGRC